MAHEFTLRSMKVLIALQENPLGTYEDLSKRTGYAKSVVYEIVQNLSSGLDRINFTRKPYFHVVATPNLWNLGLEIVDVLVSTDSEKKTQFIERLCYEHPYTLYNTRCFGDTNGLLIQFRMPMGCSNQIQNLLQIVQDKKLIDHFSVLPFIKSQSIYSTVNVDHWVPTIYSWAFNWAQWFAIEPENPRSIPPADKAGTAKKWLKKSDVAIIRELTSNARRKNIEIMECLQKNGFKFTPQTFSRRLKRIKEQCIRGYRVFLDPYIFDLYSTVFVWGHGSKEDLEILKARMTISPIPFSSTFKISNNQLFWYLVLPPTHLSELFFHLRPILTNMRFNYIDFTRSSTYRLWPPTFDDQQSDWRIDREFLVDQVLENLQKS
ncbi:MAG: hypothetical protein ACFFC7_08675 [Candidatus Hermodarchaeota archaeon]